MSEQNKLEHLRLASFSGRCKFTGQKPTYYWQRLDTAEKACQQQTHLLFGLFSDKEKSFITLATGVSVKNFFSFVKDVGTD